MTDTLKYDINELLSLKTDVLEQRRNILKSDLKALVIKRNIQYFGGGISNPSLNSLIDLSNTIPVCSLMNNDASFKKSVVNLLLS